MISHFFPFLCCSCFLHTSSFQLPTVCLVIVVWDLKFCCLFCKHLSAGDAYRSVERTRNDTKSFAVNNRFLVFYESMYLSMTFLFLTTDVFLSRRSPSRATSRVSERGRCRRSPSRAGWWADPTLWWMWATTVAPRRP